MSGLLPYAAPSDAELRGRRVLVMGLGLFHGGAAVVRFLASRGARVTVTDLRDAAVLAPALAEIADLPFDAVLGRHREEDFRAADFVAVNPAVPPESPYLAAALAAGVPLVSEVGLCLARLRSRLAFVTGSKGKTTTASLLHAMLRAAGLDAVLGGNIGAPLVHQVDALNERQVVVFEISSFQLDQLGADPRRPEVAVVTNVFPVHLDRHGTLEAYAAAKRRALDGAAAAVLNAADGRVAAFAAGFSGRVARFSTAGAPADLWLDGDTVRDAAGAPVFARRELRIPGAHNAGNAMAALLAAECLGAARAPALAAARAFAGVEHRLERVGERDGRSFVNDSIATTPQSAQAALSALDGPIVLIAGGKESPFDLADLALAIARRAAALVAIGESGPRLAAAVRRVAPAFPVEQPADFATAVASATRLAPEGGTVLLSPAFPSYDWFQNFRERGDTFRRLCGASMERSPRGGG